jgi:AraC-like DNA-binding protein
MSFWYDNISEVWKNDIDYLQIVSDLSGLQVALWRFGELERAFHWTSCKSSEHPCFSNDVLRASLEGCCRNDMPSIFVENNFVFYGVMPIGPFSLVIGPAAYKVVSNDYLLAYSADHGMDALVSIVKADFTTITQYMKLMYCHFMGTTISCEEIPVSTGVLKKWHPAGALEEYQLDQSENDRNHKIGVDFEKDLLRMVKNGDTVSLKALLSGPTPDFCEIGEFSSEQAKENEYLVVSIITLMTRAAIAGGARLEIAHELGDVYIKRLGKAVTHGEPVFGLSYSAMIEFTELVRRSKEEKSGLPHVETCKRYIEKNLRKNLQVGDIAPAIGISRTYLSRLFRQAEGITIQQYIQKEKCRHAARMLQYSDYSISQIAQYFGFSSQSYFGTCFQTWYGMSPNAYRKANYESFVHN